MTVLLYAKGFWDFAKAPVLWIGAAGVTGIIGNAGYDALKSFARRMGEPEPAGPSPDTSADAIQRMALQAVRRHCLEASRPHPPFETLHVVGYFDGGSPPLVRADRRRQSAQSPGEHRPAKGVETQIEL